MARWEAGADGRLVQAAYELYSERGFEDVTIAEIADRAGLTKRTFFRYFADKREVLFSGATAFQESVVRAVVAGPESATAFDAVVAALTAGGTAITDIGEPARQRQRLIDSSPDLREREMIKMAALTAAISDALQLRNVPPLRARLAAEAGVAVFTTAFERWAAREGPPEFLPLMKEVTLELRAAICLGNDVESAHGAP